MHPRSLVSPGARLALAGAVLPLVLLACSRAPDGGAAAGPAASRSPEIPKTLVALRLLAGTEAVAPGRSFPVGAELTIAGGWHIYWDNPGQAGLRTRLVLEAPAGFHVGEVRYPGPTRFLSPGDITSYGYHDQAVLVAPVTPPGTLEGARVTIRSSVSWLACREVCIPGKSQASLVLPVDPAGRAPGGEAAAKLVPILARLPRPFESVPGASARWEGDAASPELVVRIPGARELELYPARLASLDLASQSTRADGEVAELRARFRPREGFDGKLPEGPGVLRLGGARTYLDVRVDGAAALAP